MNIFVAKLNSSTTSDDLNQLFSNYGEVSSAKVIMDRNTGYSKRYGFIEMNNDEEAMNAINELNDSTFAETRIVVKKARPRENNFNSREDRRY